MRVKTPKLLLTMLVAFSFLLGNLPYAQAALSKVGPVNPANGFPAWYEDANGERLQLGLAGPDGLADPNSMLFEPGIPADFDTTQPIVFPGNFPGESFYWAGEATTATGAGDALLVMALEAAFANGTPVNGDQMVFSRIRVRVDVSDAGTYTVTHPYGTKTYDVTTPGPNAINDTVDIGVIPGSFNQALTGEIGPFLKSSIAPVGYLGDGATLATLAAPGPNGSIFRIDGPNIGGPGVNRVETNLFTIAGKYAIPAVTVDTQTATTATPTVTGTVDDPGATVSVVINAQAPVNATVNPDGTWSATVATALANGTYDVAATAAKSGVSGVDATTNELTVEVAVTPPPAAPTVTVNTQTATTATPTITGTVSDPAATVSVTVGTQAPVSATVNPDGTWSATVATALISGTYEVAATATNANGNGTDTTTNELTVNLAPAPTPVNITGVENNGVYSKKVKITFTGGTATLNGKPFKSGSVVSVSGQYTLVVKDAAGTPTKVNFTIIRDVRVNNIVVSDITANSATISWKTAAPSRGIVYLGTTKTNMVPKGSDLTDQTTHTVKLTKLKGQKTYFFKIKSMSTDKTVIRQSVVLKFRTK